MSFKIGSNLVIFDSAYNGPDTGGMFGQYDSSANRLESVASGHNLYFNNIHGINGSHSPGVFPLIL